MGLLNKAGGAIAPLISENIRRRTNLKFLGGFFLGALTTVVVTTKNGREMIVTTTKQANDFINNSIKKGRGKSYARARPIRRNDSEPQSKDIIDVEAQNI